jgi:anion-transporting  ArsA/GET3 family ATPase
MAINPTIIVAIPQDAYIEKNSSVFVKDKNVYDPEKRYNRVKHTIIGRSIGNGQMHPNHNYRLRYPALYEEAAGEMLPKQRKSLGFYASVLSIAERIGLYDVLVQSFGVKDANMIMDFAMYALMHHSFDETDYPSAMADQMLFTGRVWNLTMLYAFFTEEISEERTDLFRKLWAGVCAKRGTVITGTNVWIVLDHTIYAITDRDGVPIAFTSSSDGRAEYQTIEMIGWLKAYDIKVKGVIVNPAYADADILAMLDQSGITYVVKLREDAMGHAAMVEQYGYKICIQYEYMLGRYDEKEVRMDTAIDTNVIYGTQSVDRIRLFADQPNEGYAAIIYDSAYGSQVQEAWYKGVSDIAQKLQQQLDQAAYGVHTKEYADISKEYTERIPLEYADCIRIREKDGRLSVRVNRMQVQKIGDRKGYYTLASSLPLTAQEMNYIYRLKSCTEEQLFGERNAKPVLAFISSILRSELIKACTESGVSINGLVDELNQIHMNLSGNEKYNISHTESESQIKLLRACGVDLDDLDLMAVTESKRLLSYEHDFYQRYPQHVERTEPLRRVGRPKGSGKKKKEESGAKASV